MSKEIVLTIKWLDSRKQFFPHFEFVDNISDIEDEKWLLL